MLSPKDVLDYIKNSLAIDITGIEFDNDRILEIVRTTALPEFTKYVPDYNKLIIEPNDPRYKTEVENEFKIVDPDGRKVIAVEKVYPPLGSYLVTGFGLMGAGGYGNLPNFYVQNEEATASRVHSVYDFSYEYVPPNRIRILPRMSITGPFAVVYSREHAPDFSTIPMMFANEFLKMALGSVMIAMGRARTRFGSVSTPFGEINLNGDTLISDGRDLISEAKEALETATIPLIQVDIG